MDDMDKTIAPRQAHASSGADDVTMPGKRDRKPDGRFAIGELIMNRYKVLSELGQGGMGVVYRCLDETAGIEVALKALPPELSHNTIEMEDIKENFQLVAKLVHQNITICKNLERDNSNGNYYLIMECVEGEDLRRWIRRKRKEGELKLDDVLPIIKQVADALDYAHSEKIIHRDIKPGNIMITSRGKVKVLAFGLAAQIHASMTRVSMAYHGTSGTGPYMAPEQWRGRAQGAPADQYALAVMTYEMLAGHLPFESTDAAVLREVVLNETPEEIADLSKTAQDAIKRAMSKDPAERFQSCAGFVNALNGEVHTTEAIPQNKTVAQEKTVQKNGSYWRKLYSGRASRAEFGLYQLKLWLLFLIFTSIGWYIANTSAAFSADVSAIFITIFALIVAAPWNIAIAVRRLHDAGASGKRLLWLLLPVFGWFRVCQLLLQSSQEDNMYGKKTSFKAEKWNSPWALGALAAITLILPWTRFFILWVCVQTSLSSTISIPYGITSIGDRAFWECDSLTSVTIPDSVKSIGKQAFWKCDSLTSVTIPDSVKSIGEYAFFGCDSLTSVTIPRNCQLGEYAFPYSCKIIRRQQLELREKQVLNESASIGGKSPEKLQTSSAGKNDAEFQQELQRRQMQQELLQMQMLLLNEINAGNAIINNELNKISGMGSYTPPSNISTGRRCSIHGIVYHYGSCPQCSQPDFGSGNTAKVRCSQHGYYYDPSIGCSMGH